jgi:hypothetical protein
MVKGRRSSVITDPDKTTRMQIRPSSPSEYRDELDDQIDIGSPKKTYSSSHFIIWG